MKTILITFFVLFASAAFGQAGVLSNQAAPVVIPDHPQHAEPHSLRREQPIVGLTTDTYSFAQGERPLWEFGPVSVEPSLGDIARAYRKDKLTMKKAERVLEKQGS